jgi:UDP-N-acetylglucosamine 1-carboxyvinyltransferase
VSGYKHALTVVVAAAVAAARPVTLHNVPDISETWVLKELLEHLGATSSFAGGVWELDTSTMRKAPVPWRLSGRIHGSLYLVPALLARFGEVSFAGAGGDRIGPAEPGGSRPVEQVLDVLQSFGATVRTSGGLHATAVRLRGCTIDLMEYSTDPERKILMGSRASSATKTALILAAAAEGTTRLRHPVDRDATWELCDFLRSGGATISQEGDTWTVTPGSTKGPISHRLISDSTAIVTYAVCVAHVGGELSLTGITRDRTERAIEEELDVLRAMGVPLDWEADSLLARGPVEPRPVKDLRIVCNGFSTDAHPLLAVPLLRASGTSRITDHVWTSRFAYARLLTEMGARLALSGNTVTLHPSRLRPPGLPLQPTDSRAAAAAVVAALGVRGDTRIDDHGGHLDRSYELLAKRLAGVGAAIESLDSPDPG